MAAEVEALFTLSLLDREQAGLKGNFFSFAWLPSDFYLPPHFFLAVDIRERASLTGV